MARIRIDKIEIQGLRSIAKPTVFKLPKQDGFFFLTGTNKVNSDLGANGIGKSSLWDAMMFTFYGKSARGLRGPDLKTWLTTDVLATGVHFYKGKELFIVRRTHSPNSLTLQQGVNDPVKVEQDEINQLLGCDYDLFLYVVLQGQFNQFFIDLQPTEKLKVWSKILNLDEWLVRSKKAKTKLDDEQDALNTAEQSKARLIGIIETLRDSLRSQKALLASELERDEAQAKANDAEIRKSQKAIDKCDAKLKEISKDQAKVDAEQEGLKTREFTLCKKIRKRDSQLQEVDRNIAVLKDKQDRLNKEFKKFAEGVCCPWCLQDIASWHKKKMLKTLKSDLKCVKQELREEHEEEDDLQERVNNLGDKLDQVKAKIEASRKVDFALLSQKTAALKDKEFHLYQITQLEKDAKRLQKPSNTAIEIKRLKKQLSEAKEGRKVCVKAIKDSQALSISYKFWVQAFKDIRLWLVDKALAELEMHVNNSFIELGLKGWTIEFTVQHENKSGAISKGLTAKIQSPQQDRMVPWNVWSGGETQRIRIAVAVGLLRLIQSRTSFNCNLEIWDEPTEHMSKEGIEDLLNFFEVRQKDDQKQLWLVDHRTLDFGGFDGSANLTRTKGGVEIKYEY